MRINIYLRHRTQRAGGGVSPHVLAAKEGFEAHGHHPQLLNPGQAERCDLAVCWGVKKKAEMASGRRCAILERGYAGDRFKWTSFGFDGLNGRADFRNRNMPGDRWNRHFAGMMKPWRGHDGDYVLIMGQVDGDASIAGVDIHKWYARTALEIEAAGLKPVFRPHPLGKGRQVPGAPMIGGTLDEAMSGAKWVVTYNSNSGVDAILEGVPVVACDEGSMVWDISGPDPAKPPPMPDRAQWAYNLAYTQWDIEEIRSGEAWEHLKSGAPKPIRTALVLGSADCLWRDLDAATDLGEYDGVVLVNDAGTKWKGRADAWVTLHPEHMQAGTIDGRHLRGWKIKRQRAGYPDVPIWVHKGHGKDRLTVQPDRFAPRFFEGQKKSGSSGLFGVYVALECLGFDKAVCCGIPMDDSPHLDETRKWRGAGIHKDGWLQAMPKIKDRVRSMSGWTREQLGEPTPEWLRG